MAWLSLSQFHGFLNPHRLWSGLQCSAVQSVAPLSAPTLPSVSVNEIIFLPFSFSLMNGCPGDSCSWPCLHQVRCVSFYFVFHQLWLHKTPLVSGDCCQQLQSPLLVGLFACVPPNPVYSPACWQPLDETRGQWRPRWDALTTARARCGFSKLLLSGPHALMCRSGWMW